MTIALIVHKNPDGTPNGKATVRFTGPNAFRASVEGAGSHPSKTVEVDEDLGHVAASLGYLQKQCDEAQEEMLADTTEGE